MATRHHARMAVVSLLYAYDLGNGNIAEHTDEILEEKKIRKNKKTLHLDFLMELCKILKLVIKLSLNT